MPRFYVKQVLSPSMPGYIWEVRDRKDTNYRQVYVTRKQARIAAWMRNNPEPKSVEAALPQG